MGKANNKHNSVEIATFGFGLIALAVILGYLSAQLFRADGSPPNLRVTAVALPAQCCSYKVVIENSGSKTAQAANMVFERKRGSKVTEVALSVDYVPANSTREAMLAFSDTIMQGDVVVLKTISFNLP